MVVTETATVVEELRMPMGGGGALRSMGDGRGRGLPTLSHWDKEVLAPSDQEVGLDTCDWAGEASPNTQKLGIKRKSLTKRKN